MRTRTRSKLFGYDTILGKPCIVSIIDNQIKIWRWKNFILKKEFMDKNEENTVFEYVTEIDENYSIKPDEFDVPKDIIIKENF